MNVLWDIIHIPRYTRRALGSSLLFAAIIFGFLFQVVTLQDFFSMALGGEFFPDLSGKIATIAGVSYAVLYWIFTFLSIAFFGISVTLLSWLFRHSRLAHWGNRGLTIGGGIIALLASGCPGCGIWPFMLFGFSLGLDLLPLGGLEFKILSLGLLMASTGYALQKIYRLQKEKCGFGSCALPEEDACEKWNEKKRKVPWIHSLTWVVIFSLVMNQFVLGSLFPKSKTSGFSFTRKIVSLFTPQRDAKREILATKLNADGRTTTVAAWPTITEVPAEPKGMDTVEAAKVVMIAKGVPFYAPEGISFDDPVKALAGWQKYEDEIDFSSDLQKRWEKIMSAMTCDYCCGSPTRVTVISRCGCRHARAYRSMAKYILKNYGDQYSDEEILGELQRWKGIWYPKGVIEDYLLATGRSDVLGHKTHGGAGAHGMHGF